MDQSATEPLIDAHCHLGSYPAGEITTRELLDEMDRNGVTVAVISPSRADGPEETVAAKDRIIEACREHSGRLVGFAYVAPSGEAAAREELARAAAEGLVGVKIRPGLRGLSLSGENLIPVVEAAAEHRMPVYVHSSTQVRSVVTEVVELARRFSDLPFVLSHRKGPSFREDLSLSASDCPNLYFDTSSITAENITFLLRGLGPDRVVFGSGFPFGSQRIEMSKAYKATTPDAVPLVFGGNIRHVLESCKIHVGA